MGSEKQILDLQERLGRIFAKKIYGIAITGLMGLMPCRSLYCTKDAGNETTSPILRISKETSVSVASSTLKNGKCRYGDASKEEVRPGNGSGD
ncbi:MAG: hypothetical protein J6S33_04325 [Aeriscardovia sp.]|nr:hypothetical protein [Aeriscardovia sp.]